MKKKKLTPESYTQQPLTGVGLMSGFGMPQQPPDYHLDVDREKMAVPGEDTRPGTGLRHLDGRVEDIDARELPGEED